MQAANDNELPRTRAEAKAVGSKRYFTGKPCKHGHVAKRYTINGRCMVCSDEQWKDWRAANPAKAKQIEQKYREANPEKLRIKNRHWFENNREKARAYKLVANITVKARLENAIRAGVHRGLKKGAKAGRRTFDILGFTVIELKEHIARKFQPGMSWENYGEWEIDHKIPLAAHNYETPDHIDFKRAWDLKNLQPLWKPDNNFKRAKLSSSFQPSLALAA